MIVETTERQPRWLSLALTGAIAAGMLSACHAKAPDAKEGKGGRSREALVTVATVQQKDVPLQVKAIGNVEAYSSVAVRALMGGQLQRVHFQQGQDVRKGDPLFTLDARPQQAAVAQAEAALERDRAQERNASEQFKRYSALFKEGGVSQEQYDQLKTNLAAIQATVQSDRANVDNARVQLSYATITAPISGRTGTLQVTEGNLVKANDTTPLVVINQVSPVYVTFSLPQKDLPQVTQYQAQGKVKVQAALPGSDRLTETGTLTFIENAIDPTTGTIKLRATFPNEAKRLWPGQFVKVAVTLTTLPNAVVVPSRAVQTSQQGQFVYVAKADDTVDARPVVQGQSNDGDTVIEQGLKPGETIVTDGQLQLRPGAKIKVYTPGADKAPGEGGRRRHQEGR
ncbi:MAG TPA: efflux RND transporter periplasmic adaptor subunit [Stenomitos sp.]